MFWNNLGDSDLILAMFRYNEIASLILELNEIGECIV